jgi:hypothetical protein
MRTQAAQERISVSQRMDQEVTSHAGQHMKEAINWGGLFCFAPLREVSRVLDCASNEVRQLRVSADAADGTTIIVEALSPINIKGCFCQGESPPRYFWKLWFGRTHAGNANFVIIRTLPS